MNEILSYNQYLKQNSTSVPYVLGEYKSEFKLIIMIIKVIIVTIVTRNRTS